MLFRSGGRFTDINGDPSPDRGSGLATNGLVHDETLAILRGEHPG